MTSATTTARTYRLIGFPDPVNEVSARLVAAGVVTMAVLAIALDWKWLTVVLAYGFVARVVAGPRFSPLALLTTRVVVPALPFAEKPVAGAPKRFAQGIGATLSTVALVAWLAGAPGVATALTAMILVAATLEAALGFCLGCKVYGLLVRAGLVADPTCLDCADITRRVRA